VLDALAPVHRAARNLYQVLLEARKMVPQDRELIDFRDRAYEIERTAELLHEETRHSLSFIMARRAEQQAASSHRMAVSAHRLNVLAAFFFPIATLSAIFGVNLLHGWEAAAAPWPFLAMLAAGLMLGFILTSFVTHELPGPARQPPGRHTAEGSDPRTQHRREGAADAGQRLPRR
jgi:Mg2+ and Co2+ transporter CorA